MEAVSYAIDQLKKTVPIWKKEVYEDESKQWKENKECDWSSSATDNSASAPNDHDHDDVDPSLVQITASSEEINRRMDAFMARKRDELNRNNVLEFCNRAEDDDDEGENKGSGSDANSCARIDSVAPSRGRGADRSGHIRHSEVVNSVGPQMSNDYMDRRYDPLEHSMKRSRSQLEEEEEGKGDDLPVSIRERVLHLEDKLIEGKPVDKDIYKRIKALEDKVQH